MISVERPPNQARRRRIPALRRDLGRGAERARAPVWQQPEPRARVVEVNAPRIRAAHCHRTRRVAGEVQVSTSAWRTRLCCGQPQHSPVVPAVPVPGGLRRDEVVANAQAHQLLDLTAPIAGYRPIISHEGRVQVEDEVGFRSSRWAHVGSSIY